MGASVKPLRGSSGAMMPACRGKRELPRHGVRRRRERLRRRTCYSPVFSGPPTAPADADWVSKLSRARAAIGDVRHGHLLFTCILRQCDVPADASAVVLTLASICGSFRGSERSEESPEPIAPVCEYRFRARALRLRPGMTPSGGGATLQAPMPGHSAWLAKAAAGQENCLMSIVIQWKAFQSLVLCVHFARSKRQSIPEAVLAETAVLDFLYVERGRRQNRRVIRNVKAKTRSAALSKKLNEKGTQTTGAGMRRPRSAAALVSRVDSSNAQSEREW